MRHKTALLSISLLLVGSLLWAASETTDLPVLKCPQFSEPTPPPRQKCALFPT